jgi:hypothetical protein
MGTDRVLPEFYHPYILHDGRFANGAEGPKEAYSALEMALPQILMNAGTDKLGVFQAPAAGENFSPKRSINGLEVEVNGAQDGQAIVIHPAADQLLVVGYRASSSVLPLWSGRRPRTCVSSACIGAHPGG